MTPIRHLSVTDYDTHLKVPVTINGRRTVAMIDSGATGNFVAETIVRSWDLQTRTKGDQYNLLMADGSSTRVNRETIPLAVEIKQHHEELTLDVVRTANHDIILGIPWLKRHNPIIN